jgi:protoporphyrin/coproporphyrin ferrochelatase
VTPSSPAGTPGRVGVLAMAHGTPRSIEEIPAFYTEIRRGHPPSPAQLADLERRYRAIGGTSPLNERTRAQVTGLADALDALRPGHFVVEGGAKFAAPRIEDAVRALDGADVDRIIGLVLAPHSSTVSVGEYARRAREAVGAVAREAHRPLGLCVIDHWYGAPGLVPLLAARVRDAVAGLGDAGGGATVIFTAHSVPVRTVEAGDSYPAQVHESAAAVAAEAGVRTWSVAWQSAGRTDDPWLGPDVGLEIDAVAAAGGSGVVVCPIGFVSDHLEVLYDIDIEARAAAERVGLAFTRTASLNDDPRFCTVLAGVILAAEAVAADHG